MYFALDCLYSFLQCSSQPLQLSGGVIIVIILLDLLRVYKPSYRFIPKVVSSLIFLLILDKSYLTYTLYRVLINTLCNTIHITPYITRQFRGECP